MSVYLDYNASAPIDPRVLDVMIDIYKNQVGNADSRTHDFGQKSRVVVENARKDVAQLFGVSPEEVFFTSGATESNNIAIQGLQQYMNETGKKHIITSSIEHKAVLETAKAMISRGFEVDFVNPDIDGRVSSASVLSKVTNKTVLVSIMHVNNETGVIQPVDEIGKALSEQAVLFHIDATQSSGKLVEEIKNLSYDILSFSAHKLGGPQGIGGLILRKKDYKYPPVTGIMYGGQQEKGISPGTIPVALVAGLGEACRLLQAEYKVNQKKAAHIKKEIIRLLEYTGIKYKINGDPQNCLPSTLSICIEGVSSEALMIATKQYCAVSNGSACTSNSYTPSYVLTAMGFDQERIENSIRISWGSLTEEKLLMEEFKKMIQFAKALQTNN